MRLMVDLIHLYIKNITKNKTITLFSMLIGKITNISKEEI